MEAVKAFALVTVSGGISSFRNCYRRFSSRYKRTIVTIPKRLQHENCYEE